MCTHRLLLTSFLTYIYSLRSSNVRRSLSSYTYIDAVVYRELNTFFDLQTRGGYSLYFGTG